ncbi:MAG: hypothetical protein HY518_03185 [Candidatus Aenigmarchaeota archaeon]|nr:hypothetical protein [Candidatus Aenigmarchaeota archaeon]
MNPTLADVKLLADKGLADYVAGIVKGASNPDICERALLYFNREGSGDRVYFISHKLHEKEENVEPALNYLANSELVGVSEEAGINGHTYRLVDGVKQAVDAYFRVKFSGEQLKCNAMEAEASPAQAARVLDAIRALPGVETGYSKRFSIKMSDLKELEEEAAARIEAVQAYESQWLRERIGIKHRVTSSSLTHLEKNDPYWNYHSGRTKDDADVPFDLGLDMAGMAGEEIIAARVSRIGAKIPPYHGFGMEHISPPPEESYKLELSNPFSQIEAWFKPQAERDTMQARTDELRLLIEEQLEG